MKSTSTTTLLSSTVAGVVLGGLLGYFLPDFMLSISFIGQLFVNALRIVLIPVIVAAVIIGVTAMADSGRVNRATGKALVYFFSTSLIAVVIGLILALILQPGSNVSGAGATVPSDLHRLTSVSLSGLLGSVLPANMAEALGQGQFLWLVIVSIFVGAVLIAIGDKGKAVVDFFRSLNEVMQNLVRLLLFVAPLGLLSLVATAVASNSSSLGRLGSSLGMFSLAVLIGLVIQAVVVLPLVLKFLAGRPIGSFFTATLPAIATAFGTSSPAAALPVTLECVTEKAKVDSRAGALTVPLGAAINMNGTAVYAIIAAFFCVQAANAELSIIQMAVLTVSVLFVSIGSSLIPNGSLLILGVVLYAADAPMLAYTGIGLLVVVDWLFDRAKAAVNVWGDVVGAAVVANTFEFKTARRVKPVVESRREGGRRIGGPRRSDSRQRAPKPGQDRPARQPERETRPPRARQEDRKRPMGRDRKRPQRPRQDENRQKPPLAQRSSENKDRKFVMPPVPYHVLETELKSRPRPEPSPSTTTEADKAAVSLETLERERARVAAQLDQLRQKDELTDKPSESSVERPATAESADQAERVSADSLDQSYPKVDDQLDDSSSAASGAHEEKEPVDTSDDRHDHKEESREPAAGEREAAGETSQPVAFGRGKHRRTPLAKTTAPQEQPDNQAPGSPEFSSDNISFGRSKKKKPGQ